LNRPPRVSVIVVTYRRPEALERTLGSFREHVDVDDYELIVCDDGGSRGEDRRRIERLEADRVIWNDLAGYGRNANDGMRAARGAFILHLEDDCVIGNRGHFLEAGMRALTALPELGLVQFGAESGLPRLRARRRVGDLEVDVLPFARADAEGYEIFRYNNRPHLKHRRFHGVYGLYPEGYCPFETEYRFARRVNEVRGPRIGWIRDAVVFWHIGHEYGSNAWLPPRVPALEGV
jgi:glycosyltransferase involved in cell wall biosynthesis